MLPYRDCFFQNQSKLVLKKMIRIEKHKMAVNFIVFSQNNDEIFAFL